MEIDEIIDESIRNQKKIVALYKEGVLAVTSTYIQVEPILFWEIVKLKVKEIPVEASNLGVEIKNHTPGYLHLSFTTDGEVKFITLV